MKLKNVITTLLVLFLSLNAFAQAPEKFNYQAVIKNTSNEFVSNQSIGVLFEILQGSETGTVVYSETFLPTTSASGLINLEVGTGITTDDFSAIDWSNGPYFLLVNVDLTGVGTTYQSIGITELISVPYALYAEHTAPSALIQDADTDTKIQVEETADEDIIRFNMGGTEYFDMKAGRLNVKNTGLSVFIGSGAGLLDDLSTNNNVAIGNSSLAFNVNGTGNVAIGRNTLLKSTSGGNTAVGKGVLVNQTTGEFNTVIGQDAGADNLTGSENVIIGKNADLKNVTGSQNVIIGKDAGRLGGEAGSGNVFVGYQAGLNEGTDNKLYIENSDSSSPLIYGDFANDSLKVYGTLGIKDAYVFPIVDGTANQILTTNGSGETSWSTIPSNPLIQDADADTKIQVEETADEDIIRFDIAGTEYFNMNTGRLNVENTGFSVFVGRNAGQNDDLNNRNNVFVGDVSGSNNTTGFFNVGVGSRTLRDNTTGQYNTAVGGQALIVNTTGNQNTAIGMETMFSNTTGNNNVAIGRDALKLNTTGSDNVAIGYQALDANTTGNINSALGSYALSNNTTGLHNSAYGYQSMLANTIGTRNSAYGNNSLRNNTTGSYNTALGYIALDVNSTGSNNVAVGYNAGKNSTGDNNVFVGTQAGENQTSGNGNIIIGTNVNASNLTGNNQLNIGDVIEGNLNSGAVAINNNFNINSDGSMTMTANGGANAVGITQNSGVGTGGASSMEFTTKDASGNQAPRIRLKGNINNTDIEFYRGGLGNESQTMHIEGSNGRVGIGTASPSYLLEVNGTAGKPGGGFWETTSDRRLKDNIVSYKEGLDLILNINPVRYHYNAKSGYDTKPEYIGVIAQELQTVAPYMVKNFTNEGETYLNVDGSALTYVLINSVKEQNETIQSQKKEIDLLKEMLQKIQERVEVIEKQ